MNATEENLSLIERKYSKRVYPMTWEDCIELSEKYKNEGGNFTPHEIAKAFHIAGAPEKKKKFFDKRKDVLIKIVLEHDDGSDAYLNALRTLRKEHENQNDRMFLIKHSVCRDHEVFGYCVKLYTRFCQSFDEIREVLKYTDEMDYQLLEFCFSKVIELAEKKEHLASVTTSDRLDSDSYVRIKALRKYHSFDRNYFS